MSENVYKSKIVLMKTDEIYYARKLISYNFIYIKSAHLSPSAIFNEKNTFHTLIKPRQVCRTHLENKQTIQTNTMPRNFALRSNDDQTSWVFKNI